MNIYSKLYWLSRLDNLSCLFRACLIIGIITCLIMLAYRGMCHVEGAYYKPNYWRRSICIILFLIGLLGTVLLPTQKQVIFIVAAGNTIEFAQKDTSIQKVPAQATSLLSNWLEKEINNLKKQIKEISSDKKSDETKKDDDIKMDVETKKDNDQTISDMVKEQVKEQIKEQLKK